jgi:hypothetical protein
LEGRDAKPDAINGAKSVLAAGSVITKEGKFVSIIGFVKYIAHYMLLLLCTSAYKDGLHVLPRFRMCAIPLALL